MARSLLVRWAAFGVLILALTGVVPVVAMAASEDCMPAHHDCTEAVSTDCCCQPQPAATTALSVFVVTWSNFTKFYWDTTTWTADVASAMQTIETASGVTYHSSRASLPPAPLSPAESLTVLLI